LFGLVNSVQTQLPAAYFLHLAWAASYQVSTQKITIPVKRANTGNIGQKMLVSGNLCHANEACNTCFLFSYLIARQPLLPDFKSNILYQNSI
jgi:hypothetical protein